VSGASTETVAGLAGADDFREEQKSGRERLRRWAHRLFAFLVGQGLVQFLNLVTGFLLIRWLSVNEYAVYSLVSGFQGTAGVLVELGLGGSIVALLAGRTEKPILGRYIRSARFYRNRFFLFLLPAIAIAFPILASKQGVAWWTIVLLLAAILTALYFESWTAYYSVPLLIHQELRRYYRTLASVSGLRLAASLALHIASLLSAWTTAFINSAAMVLQGLSFRRDASRHILEPIAADLRNNREMLDYIRPMIPGTVFFAIHGQLTVLLISWFGRSQDVAEVGALGRLGQLFLLLTAFNSVVIAPNIAKIARERLAFRYALFLSGAIVVAVALLALSAWQPKLLLWIIGQRYMHLGAELTLSIGAACLGYVSSVMWTMHAARKWTFAWCVRAYIGVVMAVEIYGILFMDLSTAAGVLRLSVYAALATLMVLVAWAIHGFFFHDAEQRDT
jgi:O-antigen/teichoic acid export membrane protein